MVHHPRYFSVINHEITRCNNWLANGMPSCYACFDDFLFDFWPDFAWNCEATIEQIEELLENQEYRELAAQVNDKLGYNFVAVLEHGLLSCKSEIMGE